MLILANIFGFIVTNKRYFLICAALLVGLILTIGLLRSCDSKPIPKLNEAEIQRGEKAIKERNREELAEILSNADVKDIDANLATGKAEKINTLEESRKSRYNKTLEELAAEFERRK